MAELRPALGQRRHDVVAPPRPQSTLIEINNIATEIRGRGSRYAARVMVLETITPSADLVAAFEFAGVQPVGHSIIVHHENDMPVQLEERFVNATLSGAGDGDLAGSSQEVLTGPTGSGTFDYMSAAGKAVAASYGWRSESGQCFIFGTLLG